jgi:restriction endonuclease S subunit
LKTSLKNISNIQTGLFAKTDTEGDIIYLQAKHFDENGKLITNLHPDLKEKKAYDKHLLKPGDVVFASKGTKNFAALYESQNKPAVASTSFFVIRLKENSIIPEYLVWYLNQPNIQKILKAQAIGTSIVSISKAVLEELEISIPDKQMQHKILKISKLRNREKELKQKIESLREKQIQQQIINTLK